MFIETVEIQFLKKKKNLFSFILISFLFFFAGDIT